MSSSSNQYTQRLDSVRKNLDKWEVDGILVGSPANRRWLSGFTGSAGWLVVTRERAVLAADFRYWERASKEAPEFELYKMYNPINEEWPGLIRKSAVGSIGIEAQHMSIRDFNTLQKVISVPILPLEQTMEDLREIKSIQEIETIKQAAAITDEVMAAAPDMIKPGVRERELAWKLERNLRERGAHSLAFPVIVASGPNGAMAHHLPGERKLCPGDTIIIDMGANVDGYNSDLTRTFHIEGNHSDRFYRIYDLVLEAQEAALTGIKPGTVGKAADNMARSVIEEGGYGPQFGHSLGHGIGLEVHENPRLSSKVRPKALMPGAVVTVEPGIYIEDWGGVRIEDLVLITESGVELLSTCPKNPGVIIS